MPARFPEVEPHIGGPNNYAKWNTDDEVVITGISGRFPECDSMEEFKEQLLAGIDLVTADDRRWPPGKKFHFSN